MFALIVDAFKLDEVGRRQAASFEKLVSEALSSHGEKCSLQTRRFDDLDSFLFLPDEGFRQDNSAKQFDKLDFVFIDGDANWLPWDPQLEHVRVLMKMCVLTNKCTFACTFAMQMMVYVCSTGGLRLNLADQHVRGGSIEDLRSKHVIDPMVMHSSHFVDHYTGDLYQFDIDVDADGVWVPIMNVGTTLRRAMGKKLISKHHANPLNADWFDANFEIACRIDSKHIQHWLFKNVSQQQFVISWQNKWDVLQPTVAPSRGAFIVLATTTRAPVIIERKNLVGVQFHLQSRYADTIRIMENYVAQQVLLMQSNGNLATSALGLRAEIGVLTKDNQIAYTASMFSNRFMRGTQRMAPRITEAKGTAPAIHSLTQLNGSLARRTPQSSLSLAIRPPQRMLPFTSPFVTTAKELATQSFAATALCSSSLTPTRSSSRAASSPQAAAGATISGGSSSPLHAVQRSRSNSIKMTGTTRFKIPGSQHADFHSSPSASPKSMGSDRFDFGNHENTLHSFAHFTPSATLVASQLKSASSYFPEDPAAHIDWSSWQRHLPAAGIPSLGATKSEIRKFLHPQTEDDEEDLNGGNNDTASMKSGGGNSASNREDLSTTMSTKKLTAPLSSMSEEEKSKWPIGLESKAQQPIERIVVKPKRVYNSLQKYETLSAHQHMFAMSTEAQKSVADAIKQHREQAKAEAVRAEREHTQTIYALHRSRFMLEHERDRYTGQTKQELLDSLGHVLGSSKTGAELLLSHTVGGTSTANQLLRAAGVESSSSVLAKTMGLVQHKTSIAREMEYKMMGYTMASNSSNTGKRSTSSASSGDMGDNDDDDGPVSSATARSDNSMDARQFLGRR